VIKVIGVGGGGSNAVIRMVEYGVRGVEFVIMNTDVQALARAPEGVGVVELGSELTGGLGAGGIPDVGRSAAEESMDAISQVVSGADMVFVTAGMGGGTGSGAAAVVAAAAQRAGALTVGVVTRPFSFEGGRRKRQAAQAIAELKPNVDAIITVANDKLLQILPDSVPINEALSCADDILRQGVVGISDIIVQPGLINVDFADVRAVLLNAGTALMGIGKASGQNRAREAAEMAVRSPLLELAISEAKGAVFNVCGGSDLSLGDVTAASEVIQAAMHPDAMVIFGSSVNEDLPPGSDVVVTMVATGFETIDGTEEYTAQAAKAKGGPTLAELQAQAAARGDDEEEEDYDEPVAPEPKEPKAAKKSKESEIPSFLTRLKRKKK